MSFALALALLLQEKPKGLEGVGLKAEQVNRAIDRGVAYYKDCYAERDIRPLHEDLVAALAILHADGHKRHPELAKKIEAMMKAADPRVLGTYELGVLAMICDAYGNPGYLPMLRLCVQRILDTMGPGGSWNYGGEEAPRGGEERTGEKKAARLRVAGGKPLDGGKTGEVLKRSPDSKAEDGNDNSAAQYAVLGLYSGLRAGLTIDPEAWKRVLQYYLEGQYEGGGWGYGPQEETYGSMACAGIASVAIASYALGDKAWKDQAAVKKGLAWLAKHFQVAKNPNNDAEWALYYLYGLERVGRILDTEFVGAHEWYPLGARHLVDTQKDDGSWDSFQDDGPILSTGFALLFLTRATPSPMIQPKRGGNGKLVTAATTGTAAYHVILDCSGSMSAKMGGKTKFSVAQDAVCAIVDALPADAKIGLRVYGHHRIVREEDAERDVELLIPIGPLDKAAFSARVRKLDSHGRTPITLSLQETVKDLESLKEPVTVILLTDGGESTRGSDPAKAAEALLKAHPKAVLHVVAFDVNNPNERKQCEAIAKSGRGRCYAALKAEELLEQLKQLFATKLAYELADKDGKKIADGIFGDRRELAEGMYRFRCTIRGEKIDDEIWINSGETTTVTADLVDDRPVEARDVPGKKDTGTPGPKSHLDVTIGGKKFTVQNLGFTFTPAGDESEGSVLFEGAFGVSFGTQARKIASLRGLDFEIGEGALSIQLGEERSLASKEGTLRIVTASEGEITGTIRGVFVENEEEIQLTGSFRAILKKE